MRSRSPKAEAAPPLLARGQHERRGALCDGTREQDDVPWSQRTRSGREPGAGARAEQPAPRVGQRLGGTVDRQQQWWRVTRRGVGDGRPVRVDERDRGGGAPRLGQVLRVHVGELESLHDVDLTPQTGPDDRAHLGCGDRSGHAEAGYLADHQRNPVVGQHHDVEPRATRFDGVAGHTEQPVEVDERQHGHAHRLDHGVERGDELDLFLLGLRVQLHSSRYLLAVPEVPLAIEFDETTAVLAVSGDVDEESIETLRAAIEEHSAGYTTGLTVDLTGATYLPSVAVGVLVRAGQSFAAAGGGFELVATSGSLAQRVLTVSAIPHRAS